MNGGGEGPRTACARTAAEHLPHPPHHPRPRLCVSDSDLRGGSGVPTAPPAVTSRRSLSPELGYS